MKPIFIFLSLLFSLLCFSQEGYQQERTLQIGQADHFKVDQFGNLYLVRGDELTKLDERGSELYSYSNPLLGEIYQVDVFNPLKPYVFFKNAAQFAVLDNRLNENEQLNLLDYGFLDVQFISFSDQENMWLYDQVQDKLFRFNITERKITNQSLNLTQLLGKENEPANMLSTVENIYVNVPGEGVMVFDATGAYKKLLPLTALEDFDVKGSTLFGLKEGKLFLYDLQNAELLPVLFPQKDLTSLCFSGNRLYLFNGRELYRYLTKRR